MTRNAPPLRPRPKPHRNPWYWLVFVVVFLLILVPELLRGDGAERGPSRAWIAPVVLVVGVGGYVAWTVLRARRFNAENSAALAMLREGAFDAARERFEALVKRHPRPRDLNHVALFNLAWTELLAGELALARQRMAQIEAERDPKARSGFVTLLPSRLAYVHALQGELDDARAWLRTSRERGVEETTNRAVIEAWETASDAIVACRAGEPARAKELLAARWLALENSVTGELLRPLRAVRAFALDAASKGTDAAAVEAQLQPVREHAGSELRHLGASWPAMRAFLAARKLG
ncbi:MAG: hypothetical protein IPJ77_08670 [Planctomycetes bacterium]|nr:hypothetical protein [Planctomycetota bacterium]